MADVTVGTVLTSTNTNLFTDYILRKFLIVLDEHLIMQRFGRKDTLPLKSGHTARWVSWTKMAAATSPLTEGTEKATPSSITTGEVEATIKQYGDYVQISDLFEMTAISGSMNAISERLGRQAALTIDTLILTELENSTNSQYGDATVSSGYTSADTLIADGLRLAANTLQSASVPTHPATPGGKYYAGVIHPEVSFDLQGETGTGSWQDNVRYVNVGGHAGTLHMDGRERTSGASNLWEGSPGTYAGIALAVTQNIQSGNVAGSAGANVSTYKNFVLGQEGFGTISLKSKAAKPSIIIRRPGPQSVSQPLGMNSTVGWKVNWVVKLLSSSQVLELFTAK